MVKEYDVVIIGGGAAGLSAALYAGRAQLRTLVIEQLACGGQIINTDAIENYPGFPGGITGPELAQLMERQAMKAGAGVAIDEPQKLDLAAKMKTIEGVEDTYTAPAVIIASGGEHNKLEVPGEDEYSARGVSYCATCDANFFANEDVVVVGGGDAAIDEGLYLARIVNKVTVVHRRDQLRASRVLQQRAFDNPKMDFIWNHVVREIKGNGSVDRVLLENLKSEERYEFSTNGVFIYIGFHPNSEFLQGQVPMDNAGHILTNIRMETDLPGVFACGDVRQYSDKQLGTAVGDGITAALSAYRYLSEG